MLQRASFMTVAGLTWVALVMASGAASARPGGEGGPAPADEGVDGRWEDLDGADAEGGPEDAPNEDGDEGADDADDPTGDDARLDEEDLEANTGASARSQTRPAAARVAPGAGLGALEAEVLAETNLMRSNPPAYADKLRRLRSHYEGTMLRVPGQPPILTSEGVGALDEAIAVLERTGRRPTLALSDGLTRAARDHATDLGRSGRLGHEGSDGSRPDQRASRHGRWHELVAENITFGSMTAEDVVIDLLVDDGVDDRGHREVLLDRALRVAGVACGPHPSYRRTCVMDYATSFDDAVVAAPPRAPDARTAALPGYDAREVHPQAPNAEAPPADALVDRDPPPRYSPPRGDRARDDLGGRRARVPTDDERWSPLPARPAPSRRAPVPDDEPIIEV